MWPLVKRIHDLVPDAVDGLQDSQAGLNEFASNVIHINRWASYTLGIIKHNDLSLNNTLRRILGPIIGVQSNITEVAFLQELLSMTSTTKKFLSNLAVSRSGQVKDFGKLKVILEDIALVALKDKSKLDVTKLKNGAYWIALFRTYDKVENLNERMAVFATFYRHTEEAQNFALISQAKIQTIHRAVGKLQEKLVEASLATLSAQREFLQQYIDMLNAGVDALEASKANNAASE